MYNNKLKLNFKINVLGCFYIWAIVNSVAINMSIQISVRVSPFSSFGYIPRSEVAGLYDNSIFNFLINFILRSESTVHLHRVKC